MDYNCGQDRLPEFDCRPEISNSIDVAMTFALVDAVNENNDSIHIENRNRVIWCQYDSPNTAHLEPD
jgi:hypothetical protein